MEKKQDTFFDRLLNPIIQAACILGLSLLLMLALQLVKMNAWTEVDDRVFWVIAGTSLLIYALFNSIGSLATKNMNQYWSKSTLCYAGLMVSSGTLAYLFSHLTIGEAGTFRWIFMVLTFGYLLFLSMMRFMRKVVTIAQVEDSKWEERKR